VNQLINLTQRDGSRLVWYAEKKQKIDTVSQECFEFLYVNHWCYYHSEKIKKFFM